MARVFVGIGSNEGDRLANISRAIQQLGQSPGVRLIQLATIQETEPVGPPQGLFLNTVVELETVLSPRELLGLVKRLERELGRLPTAHRWGPRPIDLDLLLYDDQAISEQDLLIPHPQLHARRFVLEPLAQLAPELIHPVRKQTIAQLLHQCSNPSSLSSHARD